ncbi:hypothetical protein MPNT_130041 [Candidatus Methylacidithermus pantelleriae]|uniref:Uncharacterized protein n=1 Tax=Candidatus Methylacidithermus pantelleriae TaxID=2744239 RepID=A0A8J2FVG4_9BACT|nr:hypothetical protein MPNT_130041 [Candidatus Methylacidithermus pantelleriae]
MERIGWEATLWPFALMTREEVFSGYSENKARNHGYPGGGFGFSSLVLARGKRWLRKRLGKNIR